MKRAIPCFALALAFSACVVDTAPELRPCDAEGRCPEGFFCASGYCVDGKAPDCLKDADCDDGDPCTLDRCDSGACSTPESAELAPSCEVLSEGDGACVRSGAQVRCLIVDGRSCARPEQCRSGRCDCADEACSTLACTRADCSCQYADATSCVAALSEGREHPGKCDGANACHGGACKVDLGQSCADHAECGAGHCECADATCSARICAATDCLCGFGPESNPCGSGVLSDGTEDPLDCTGDSACWGGRCLLKDLQPCRSDDQCGSGDCECSSATCAARVCAPQCCLCSYVAANGSCGAALEDGIEDPGDCEGLESCYGGICKKKLGRPCSADAECGSAACECADGGCLRMVCAPAHCPCRYSDAEGCLDDLYDGTEQPWRCSTTQGCYGGQCLLHLGESCARDGECSSGSCACSNDGCTARACAAQSCACHALAPDGSCGRPLTAGVADPEHCDGANACWLGQCLKRDGEPCAGNAECGSGRCACTDTDPTCGSGRVCAAESCVCSYGPGGSCQTPLPDGTIDPEECEGERACYGGLCLLSLGEGCSTDGECGSLHCECADARCSTRACTATSCTCKYGVAGACAASLEDGLFDPGDCEGLSACFGGECAPAPGAECSDDSGCGTGHCECADARCSTRICAEEDCACRYGPANAPCSAGNLDDGTDDLPDCAGASACYAGVCKLELDEPCDADESCGSGTCACAETDCSSRLCAGRSCSCRVYEGAGRCGDLLDPGVLDPGYCEAGEACYAGGCMTALGTACASNSECGSGHCECADARCSARVCAPVSCLCGFSREGACVSLLNNGVKDPEDCWGNKSCWGGSCKTDNGKWCAAHAECQDGHCECANADCSYRVCAPSACLCGYGNDGACDHDLPPGALDPEDCSDRLACRARNDCRLVNGQPCGSDGDCGSGHCEYTDSSEQRRICAEGECVCQQITESGACGSAYKAGERDRLHCSLSCCEGGGCGKIASQFCGSDAECCSGSCELIYVDSIPAYRLCY